MKSEDFEKQFLQLQQFYYSQQSQKKPANSSQKMKVIKKPVQKPQIEYRVSFWQAFELRCQGFVLGIIATAALAAWINSIIIDSKPIIKKEVKKHERY